MCIRNWEWLKLKFEKKINNDKTTLNLQVLQLTAYSTAACEVFKAF